VDDPILFRERRVDLDTRYLIALIGTLVIELPLLALVARRLGLPLQRTLGIGIAANFFTHGSLWLVMGYLSWGGWGRVAVAELTVVLVEGVIYAAMARIRPVWVAFAVALGLNLASYLGGEVFWAIF